MTSAALASLLAASIAFVGTHFAMSHPLRAPMVRSLGETGFQIVYSLVSVATLGWMIAAFLATESRVPVLPWGYGTVEWIATSVLSLLALVLVVGSAGPANPAMGLPGAEDAARAKPAGVFALTRHPMMWGFALWAASHVVAAPTARTLIVSTAIAVLALVGSATQDAKKRRQMGEAWLAWEQRTSFAPRFGRMAAIRPTTWLFGAVLWLLASAAHGWFGGMEAGVWRWF